MIAFVTCDRYQTIEYAADDVSARDIVRRCRELEQERNDGYAVLAWQDGRIIATAEGLTDARDDNRAYRAAYDHACGYHD